MKVGIITFQRADNFGAALQCWALQTYLENQGYDVRVLEYSKYPHTFFKKKYF